MRLLIVEDQEWTLASLKRAVGKVMPAYSTGFSEKDYDIAKWYLKAKELVGQNAYDIVLLDHCLPFADPGDLEGKVEEIGYGLVGPIKKKSPKTVVVGTSSLDPRDLQGWRPAPDYRLDKLDAEKELDRIMKEINGEGIGF